MSKAIAPILRGAGTTFTIRVIATGIAYVDSSVILRAVLGQAERLPEWNRITKGIVSRLAEVECMRTIDRLRIAGTLTMEESALR